MSAIPGNFTREPAAACVHEARSEDPHAVKDAPVGAFWHWFAVGVLLLCWIAEATMYGNPGS